ncbi:phosphotyrosine protein phosphatase [Micrococcus sp. NPDC078436]|uniref:arsenate-mycothiol transferase ArsC n=1 Tax=Micrococcus sp. NPDC078436 TaxID=3154960 RepID=UPI00344BF7B9
MSWTSRPPIRSPFAATPAAGRADDGDAPVRILTVCTGNICRSAYAQHVLQHRLDELLGPGRAVVTSVGTGPNQALAVPEPILELAPAAQVRKALAAHRPRQLTARTLAGQDLVLAATQGHLDAVLREDPGAVRRAFTLLEAGRLAEGGVAAEGGVRELTAAMAAGRPRLAGAEAWDLPDPFRGPVQGYVAMARVLDPALEGIARAVARSVDG